MENNHVKQQKRKLLYIFEHPITRHWARRSRANRVNLEIKNKN